MIHLYKVQKLNLGKIFFCGGGGFSLLYFKHKLSIHFELNVEINKLKDYMSQQVRITSEPLAFLCVLRIYYTVVNSLPLATQETFSTPKQTFEGLSPPPTFRCKGLALKPYIDCGKLGQQLHLALKKLSCPRYVRILKL